MNGILECGKVLASEAGSLAGLQVLKDDMQLIMYACVPHTQCSSLVGLVISFMDREFVRSDELG